MFLGTTCEELHGPDAMQRLGRIRSICNEKEKNHFEETKQSVKKKKKYNSRNKFIPLENEYDRGTENHDPAKLRYYLQPQGEHCIARLYPGGACPPCSHQTIKPLVCGCVRKNGLQDSEERFLKGSCIKNEPWQSDKRTAGPKYITCYRESEAAKARYEKQLVSNSYWRDRRAAEDLRARRQNRNIGCMCSAKGRMIKCPSCCECVRYCQRLEKSCQDHLLNAN